MNVVFFIGLLMLFRDYLCNFLVYSILFILSQRKYFLILILILIWRTGIFDLKMVGNREQIHKNRQKHWANRKSGNREHWVKCTRQKGKKYPLSDPLLFEGRECLTFFRLIVFIKKTCCKLQGFCEKNFGNRWITLIIQSDFFVTGVKKGVKTNF